MRANLDLKSLESAIVSFLEKRYPDFLNAAKGAGKEARALSDLFTKSRDSISDYMKDPRLRAAYAAHFTITNAAKAFFCLNLIADQAIDRDFFPTSFLDIGCGLGASSLAASAFTSSIKNDSSASFTILDSSREAIRDASSIFNSFCGEGHELVSVCSPAKARHLTQHIKQKFDVVFASNILNEMDHSSSLELCEYVLQYLVGDNGYFIIIEPALREQTRNLMAIRDILLSKKLARTFSPCLHDKPCPMLLANDRDWCHFYLNWSSPELICKMDNDVGTNHKYLKLSYLILQRPQASRTASCSACARAVSSLIETRGKKELMVCSDDGQILKLRRLDKNKGETNSSFDDCSRGDVVKLPSDFDMKKDTNFSILKSFFVLNSEADRARHHNSSK